MPFPPTRYTAAMATDRRTRVVRFLRIAVSAVCLVGCALLIAMWVWTYSHSEIRRLFGHTFMTEPGELTVDETWAPHSTTTSKSIDWMDTSRLTSEWVTVTDVQLVPAGTGITIPIWLPAVAFAALAAMPWIPWSNRFSLRSLLIGITFIAAILGLIVYLMR